MGSGLGQAYTFYCIEPYDATGGRLSSVCGRARDSCGTVDQTLQRLSQQRSADARSLPPRRMNGYDRPQEVALHPALATFGQADVAPVAFRELRLEFHVRIALRSAQHRTALRRRTPQTNPVAVDSLIQAARETVRAGGEQGISKALTAGGRVTIRRTGCREHRVEGSECRVRPGCHAPIGNFRSIVHGRLGVRLNA